MSQENVEVFMRVVDAYNRRDFDGFAASFDPEGEWYPATVPVEGGEAYIGHRGLERWWANVDAAFQDFQANVEDIRDRMTRSSRSAASGVSSDAERTPPTLPCLAESSQSSSSNGSPGCQPGGIGATLRRVTRSSSRIA